MPRRPRPLVERFEEKFERRGPAECWPWIAYVNAFGYARFRVASVPTPAQRVAYELYVGEIPPGHDVHHVCGVRHCMNPVHLEVVRHDDHCRLTDGGAYNRRKTHCPQGHPYDEANTYRHSSGRQCQTCRQARDAGRKR
jgi:hypothetical protein